MRNCQPRHKFRTFCLFLSTKPLLMRNFVPILSARARRSRLRLAFSPGEVSETVRAIFQSIMTGATLNYQGELFLVNTFSQDVSVREREAYNCSICKQQCEADVRKATVIADSMTGTHIELLICDPCRAAALAKFPNQAGPTNDSGLNAIVAYIESLDL